MFEESLKRLRDHTSGWRGISIPETTTTEEERNNVTGTEENKQETKETFEDSLETFLEAFEREQTLQKRRCVRDLSLLWEG